MSKPQCLNFAIGLLLSVLLWSSPYLSAEAQPTQKNRIPPTNLPSNATSEAVQGLRNVPLTRPEQLNIIDQLTFDPSRVSQQIRVTKVVSTQDEKEQVSQKLNRRTARAIVFNYTRGTAARFLVDAGTGEVLQEDVLSGRPQPSLEEVREAVRVIQGSSELRPLLEAGAVLEGGFAVVGPMGAAPTNRYVQMQILSVDRNTMLRMVTVDLTTGKVVATANLP
jgi:hypothetical protein